MIAIVTGANSGMGKATVAALADKGYETIMLCRDSKRGSAAYEELMAENAERKIKLMLCDLGNYSSIRSFVEEFKRLYGNLDLLINNAGFISLDRQLTDEGIERQFGINHIGHFLLTELLLWQMKEGARIVIVASGGHKAGKIHFDDINLTKGFNVIKAYGQSKLANVLYARELSARVEDRGITVNCCHPGAVATNIGISRDTGFGKTITGMLRPFFLTPAEGAKTALFLATDSSVQNVSGEYFYKCKIAKSSKASKDMEAAKRLYDLSARLVRLENYVD